MPRQEQGLRGFACTGLYILSLVPLLFLGLCPHAFSQGQEPEPKSTELQELVEEWFSRLNDLDDWWISMDGREDNGRVVDRFLELYSPDASLKVGPSDGQLGTVVYEGRDRIRSWADHFSRSFLELNYRTHFRTENEMSVKPVYVSELPWGGTAVAVEFTGVYTARHDRRRFWIPGAAFFVFNDAGEIRDLRLYLARDELEETKPYVGM